MYLPDKIVKIQMHKGIAMKVDEHNPTIEGILDIFRLDRHYLMIGRICRRTCGRKPTILVRLKHENPVKNLF